MHMISIDAEKISITELGKIVCKLYIDPLTGYIFFNELKDCSPMSEIKLLYTICKSPDMEILPVRSKDSWIEDEIHKIKEIDIPPDYSPEYDFFLSQIKTAFCLKDWINEVHEDDICDKYGIGPGDLRRITETGEWLAHSIFKIAHYLGHPQCKDMLDLEKRIKYGVKRELLELVDLKGIGRKRARRLYDYGIKSKKDIVEKRDRIPLIIGKKVAENVLNQVEGK